MSIVDDLIPELRCPDDGGELQRDLGALLCRACGRSFPVTGGNMVSLVSREPAVIEESTPTYQTGYLSARAEDGEGEHWRIEPGAPARSILHKQRQVERVERLLGEDRDLICDYSAGPGYYTFGYAGRWRRVIHCDLSGIALRQARQTAEARRIDNVLFVRMDYLKPPFRRSLPNIICMDSLIRGPGHERAVLGSIRGSLAAGGTAVVDFHNWWHNPLRRLGLLRQNFGDNRSYAARELPPLLASAGIERYERIPFHQELAAPRSLVSFALPPTRWMYRFTDGPC
jgi:SAM-dependent methyltransferase